MRASILTILGLLSVALLESRADVLSDWQTGAQVTAPDGWRTSFTPPDFPGFGARSYDEKSLTSVDFNVDDRTASQPLSDQSDFVKDFVKNVQSQGSVVTATRTRKLNGTDFLVVSLSTKVNSGTNFMNVWFTIVKGHTCEICLSVKNTDPDKDDALNGIIHSFRVTDHVLAHSPVLTKQEQLDKDLRDHPFNFYGVVIDENKQPVSGATAKVLVEGDLDDGHKEVTRPILTDKDGRFSLENVHSYGVNIVAMKDGYTTVSNDRGVWSWFPGGRTRSDTMPTKDRPAVFILNKTPISATH